MMKKQRGVTMIELLIAMVLGLSLVAGIGQLFVQSQKSFRLQRNLSDMTDDATFALEAFAKSILLAGYSESGTISDLPVVTSVNSIVSTGITDINFEMGEFIHGKDSATSSQLVYRYKLSSQGELDNSVCTSNLISYDSTTDVLHSTIVTIRFYKDSDSDGLPVLYCKAAKENNTQSNPNAQPLISEVERLVFRYGIKTDAGLRYYTDATTVTATNLWKNVFAVQIFLVMRSAEDNLVHIQNGYKIDGVQQTPTDKRLYKTFSKTVFFRTMDK